MELDSVLQIASATKLITTICVLQGVEDGLFSLDEDVTMHVPTLARQEVLTGFTWYGRPLTRPRQHPFTLRHLLTHTAGAGYDFISYQPIWRWKWWHKIPVPCGHYVEERLAYPMVHEPGDGWTYGSGASWAGKVLEKVSGTTLEEWVRRRICEPLGLDVMTYFPERVPALKRRMAALSLRHSWTQAFGYWPPEAGGAVRDCMGGEGLHATVPDLLAVTHSLLIDDGCLLRPETTAMMF